MMRPYPNPLIERAGMKICVVCQEYPSAERPDAMAFTHARNLYYLKQGHEVHVLSFGASSGYDWDGLKIRPEADFDDNLVESFDIFVFHSPNLRNHLRFILRHGSSIRAKVLIAHGHEFIDWCNQSGGFFPFDLTWKRRLKIPLVRAYDWLKIKVWSWYFQKQSGNLSLVFVSDWLRRNAEACMGVNLSQLLNVSVIANPVHPVFQSANYDPSAPKQAHFVTLRPFDEPKYAVDVVVEFARRHPQWTVDIYGKGRFFDHNPAPPNVRVIQAKFPQTEMPELFNKYRAALLPTRWDSQGVLMCEMATFGMPLVVSNIEICKLMVGEFENVAFIDNEAPELRSLPAQTLERHSLKQTFGPEATVARELELFDSVAKEACRDRTVPGAFLLSSILGLTNGLLSVRRGI